MSDGMGRELAYLSSHATNRYFIPNWGKTLSYQTYIWDMTRVNFILIQLKYPFFIPKSTK